MKLNLKYKYYFILNTFNFKKKNYPPNLLLILKKIYYKIKEIKEIKKLNHRKYLTIYF